MKYITVCLIFFNSFSSLAQQDAWVYLTNKENVAISIANPTTILSQKAVNRKNAHGVVIDARDVPVNENYISQIKAATGITVKAKSKWFNAVHVRGSKTNIDALASMAFVSSIQFADKNLNTSKQQKQKKTSKFKKTATAFNYGTTAVANQIKMFNGNLLHADGFTGTGMTVAVIDAGFPGVNTLAGFQRLRDASNIIDVYDFVDRDTDVYTNTTSSHGTQVLSTMAGFIKDAFVGTAPDASYYLFTTEDDNTENPVEESYWVEAVERADSLGVDVINTSLSYGAFYDNTNYNYAPSEYDGNSIYITKGANIAFEKGLLLINSAGNEGNEGLNAPADAAGVLTIGAVKADGTYASFSSVGSSIQPTQKPDVVAQGQASYVIDVNNNIVTLNGTSFSSPILAGGIVCLWQALPNKSNAEIMQLVRESASQYTTPDYFLGYGIPNLYQAYNNALPTDGNIFNEDLKIYPNPAKDIVYFGLPENQSGLGISIFDVSGKKLLSNLVTKSNNQVDVSSLSTGLYLLKIQLDKQPKTIKLIKK